MKKKGIESGKRQILLSIKHRNSKTAQTSAVDQNSLLGANDRLRNQATRIFMCHCKKDNGGLGLE